MKSKLYLVFLLIGMAFLSTRGMVFSYKYPDSFDAIDRKVKDNDLVTLNEKENIIYSIAILEQEVNNGGFNQYFFNSSGELALLTLVSLEKVKATKTKGLLEEAIQVAFNGDIPNDWNKRQEKLLTLDESQTSRLHALDQEFYKYKDNITQMVNDYLTR